MIIQLRYCSIEWTSWGCNTRFEDGTEVGSYPHPELPHYSVIAHRTGYGDDLLAYCREHEFAHCFVEQEFHDRPSRTLWALANGGMLSGAAAAYEENMAQTFQRWMRANERPILGGVDWDKLKREALALLNGHLVNMRVAAA